MIIEICGLPGVGKSTLIERVVGTQDLVVVKVDNKMEILWFFFKGFFRRPFFTMVTTYLAAVSSPSLSLFWNSVFVRPAKSEKALSCKAKLCVVEEGYHQNMLSFSTALLDEVRLRKYIESIPNIGKVLVLEIDEKTRAERLSERGWSTMEVGSKNGLKRSESTLLVYSNFKKIVKDNTAYSFPSSLSEVEINIQEIK